MSEGQKDFFARIVAAAMFGSGFGGIVAMLLLWYVKF